MCVRGSIKTYPATRGQTRDNDGKPGAGLAWAVADWETVERLGSELPEVEAGTSYRTPALKVRGKMFARLREDGETLVVWTDSSSARR